ncbi:hypothetical protein FCT18_05515 [Lysinibacillus sphaericus]|nr:hypothetical protein FCT18_05515 [Lysinibacillus sphaericus]UDK99085.1 hypothetical protein EYB33_10875 [Lysinibacillus sphaericus]
MRITPMVLITIGVLFIYTIFH